MNNPAVLAAARMSSVPAANWAAWSVIILVVAALVLGLLRLLRLR